jgi:hypothetical protein
LFRIGVPVRGEAQHTVGAQRGRQQSDERSVDQAPLVMALLVPRIREEHQDLIEGLIPKLVLQYLDGIVTDDAQVADLRLFGAQQQPAHSRAMHLDA